MIAYSIVMMVIILIGLLPLTIHNSKPPQLTLQIVPTPLGTAPMTEEGPPAQRYVALVQVIRLVMRGLGAEWTFLHDHVGRGDAKVIRVRSGGEVGQLLAQVGGDLLRGEVERLVVFGDEHFVPFRDRYCCVARCG